MLPAINHPQEKRVVKYQESDTMQIYHEEADVYDHSHCDCVCAQSSMCSHQLL